MKETPILMKPRLAEMTLADIKTNTRRVIDLDLVQYDTDGVPGYQDAYGDHHDTIEACPYGRPGDLLWVKEAHYLFGHWIADGVTKTGKPKQRFIADQARGVLFKEPKRLERKYAEIERCRRGWYKRSSLFMPRWASRLILEITDIRAERLQDIGDSDILAEGTPDLRTPENGWSMRDCFHYLWDSINSERGYSWDSNPWVWSIRFKRVDGGRND